MTTINNFSGISSGAKNNPYSTSYLTNVYIATKNGVDCFTKNPPIVESAKNLNSLNINSMEDALKFVGREVLDINIEVKPKSMVEQIDNYAKKLAKIF